MRNDEKYSIDDVEEIVNTEGLAESILFYISPEEIDDRNLSELWFEAKGLLEMIDDIVGGY